MNRKNSVLVLDDDPLMLRTWKRLLRHSYEVSAFDTVAAAISHLETEGNHERYTAVLCDLNLGDRDGVDFFEHAERKWPALAKRIAFVTGGATKPRQFAFLSRTANPVLEKPFGWDDALALLDSIAIS
jgi:DNA-binding NtrC family response regulator